MNGARMNRVWEPPGAESIDERKSDGYWKNMVNRYEKRNAMLEQRQNELAERLRAMERGLPTMLVTAMMSIRCGTESPKIDMQSILSRSGVCTRRKESTAFSVGDKDSPKVEFVYRREKEDGEKETNGPDDDGAISVSSEDLAALGRIQELAERERQLKRYIHDLESREQTFCQALEKANELLNDPSDCAEDDMDFDPGTEKKEPLSDDPFVQRLQRLEFNNKRILRSMKGLRREKNVLVRQTELLKSQLRNTQEKLGEVQKEVLGDARVIPVMGEPSLDRLEAACSCASRSNREEGNKIASPKTLEELAERFEDVLHKAKIRGLCKLSGPIKDTVVKLKQLSESEKGYACLCDGPSQRTCACERSGANDLGQTGDWLCNSLCFCDLDILEEEEAAAKDCACGCRNDRIACECGCNVVDEAGDLRKILVEKLSQDFADVICKDCGNCKCGDDHSKMCPDCVEACACSCTAQTVGVSVRRDVVQEGNPNLHPCFECEMPEPCDICFHDESETTMRLQAPIKLDATCKQCAGDEETSMKPEESAGSGARISDRCPCGCDDVVESADEMCCCGCGSLKLVADICPCGCDQTTKKSRDMGTEVAVHGSKSECDCECARSGIPCEFCCCVESVEKFLVAEEEVREETAESRLESTARKLEVEIDRVGKRNEILRQFVASCARVPPHIDGGSSTTEGCPFHSSTPIRSTISGLRVAVELLRAKSRRKDGMIAVLAENLGRNANLDRIAANLTKPKLFSNSTDFDQCALYNYLQDSEPETCSSDVNDKTLNLPTDSIPDPNATSRKSLIPAPKDFKIVGQICEDCLLVSWTLPDDVSMITGYEIFVNGYTWNRVGSAVRTEALLFSLDISCPLVLTLYSVGRGRLISKPVNLTYPPCRCGDNRPFYQSMRRYTPKQIRANRET